MFTPSGYAFSGRKLAENLSKIRSLSNAIQVLLEHVKMACRFTSITSFYTSVSKYTVWELKQSNCILYASVYSQTYPKQTPSGNRKVSVTESDRTKMIGMIFVSMGFIWCFVREALSRFAPLRVSNKIAPAVLVLRHLVYLPIKDKHLFEHF